MLPGRAIPRLPGDRISLERRLPPVFSPLPLGAVNLPFGRMPGPRGPPSMSSSPPPSPPPTTLTNIGLPGFDPSLPNDPKTLPIGPGIRPPTRPTSPPKNPKTLPTSSIIFVGFLIYRYAKARPPIPVIRLTIPPKSNFRLPSLSMSLSRP